MNSLFLTVVLISSPAADDVPIVLGDGRGLTITEDHPLSIADRLEYAVPAMLRTFVDASIVSGAVIVVTDPQQSILTTAAGYRMIQPPAAMAVDDRFFLASITKPMTAAAFLRLVDENRVALDDPVSKYLPAFVDTKLADGTPAVITVRHCLTHTSGLDADRESSAATLAEFVDEMAGRPVRFEPGSRWQYSRAIDVIGRIAEVVTGQTYAEFMRTQLWDPLGMADTSFEPPRGSRDARPYRLVEGTGGLEPTPADDLRLGSFRPYQPAFAVPSAGAFSTGGDLARFARLLLNRGRAGGQQILTENAVDEMTGVQTGELTTGFTPGNGWGLGVCVVRYPQHVSRSLSPGSFGHGGVWGPQLWVDPQRGIAQILLYERSDIGNSDGSDVREAMHETVRRGLDARRSAEPGR